MVFWRLFSFLLSVVKLLSNFLYKVLLFNIVCMVWDLFIKFSGIVFVDGLLVILVVVVDFFLFSILISMLKKWFGLIGLLMWLFMFVVRFLLMFCCMVCVVMVIIGKVNFSLFLIFLVVVNLFIMGIWIFINIML